MLETKGLSLQGKKDLCNAGVQKALEKKKKDELIIDDPGKGNWEDQTYIPPESKIAKMIREFIYKAFAHFNKDPLTDRLEMRQVQIYMFDLLFANDCWADWDNDQF